LIGSGVLADSLASQLGALVSERAACDQGPAIARVLAPDLIVLAGDAAQDRGATVLAQLAQGVEPRVPVLVICAPNHAGLTSQPMARHVALLTPEGGITECARRVRAVVELFAEEGLAHCSFQQLADTVAPGVRLAPSTTATSPQTKQVSVTQQAIGAAARPAPAGNASPLSPHAANAPTSPASKILAKLSATGAAGAQATPAHAAKAQLAKPAASNAQPAAQPTPGKAVTPAGAQTQPLQSTPLTDGATRAQPRSAEPVAAAKPAETSQPAAISTSTPKQPAAATPQAQAAERPVTRTALGPAQPSAATHPTAPAEVAVVRGARPALAAKPQAVVASPVKPSVVSRSETSQRNMATRDVSPAGAKTQRQVGAALSSQAGQQVVGSAPTAEPKRGVSLNQTAQAPSPPQAAAIADKPHESTATQNSLQAAAVSGAIAEPEILLSLTMPPSQAPAAAESSVGAPVTDPPVVVSLSDRPTNPPDSRAAKHDASRLEPEVVVSSSDRPTNPPEPHAAIIEAAGPSEPPVVAASREPAEAPRAPFAAPVRVAAAEPEIVVSLSEPAPIAAAQRSVAKAAAGAGARDAASPRRPRRAANPFEPARGPVQSADAARARANPAPQPVISIAPVAEPDITVSFSEPPSSAPHATAAHAAEPARPRKARRVGNPFDPAPIRPQQASPQAMPGLRVLPPSAEVLAAEAALSDTRPSANTRWVPILLVVVAAVGGGFGLFQLLHGAEADAKGGVAALGALQQAAAVPAPTTPSSSAAVSVAGNSVAPVGATPAGETASSSAAKPAAETTLANRSSSSARQPEHEPAAGEQSSAQVLVDEGMVFFKDGRFGLAEASYLKALKTQPGYPRAMAALVRVHIARHDGAEAVRWAKQLVEKQPETSVNLLLLGDAQQLRGDLGAAEDSWTEAARRGNAIARQRLSAD
jgi:hypothetical protein